MILHGLTVIAVTLLGACQAEAAPVERPVFEGKYISGTGDVTYLELLDTCGRLFWPDAKLQNISMLYTPLWNGFVEGPTWGAWWIQNSYGTTYCTLPFATEPYNTWLLNSQDLWYSQMGDGKRVGANNWQPPDGCLCDAASPGWIYYKQGDGRIDIHDWGMEFTAAGVVMQAEWLLVNRDAELIEKYLPMMERCLDFIESRRDPQNNLFLAGPAGNLLAPSYAGYLKPDGTYDMAYLAGLSVTTIAALDRLIELEKMLGRQDKVEDYTLRRRQARQGLSLLITDEGYLVKSIDPDGTKHGVYGAEKYGYFEAVSNHDAICFDVVDDLQAQQIYRKINSLPGLRPYDVIITNYPSLDDMYVPEGGLFTFGTWVNGGHWTTCEARMIMAYFRLGEYDDARRSMEYMLSFYQRWRADNPMVNFGGDVYQPNQPINTVYDNWGAPAAMLRGLFKYDYTAEGLRITPQIPDNIHELTQHFPVLLGKSKLWLSVVGEGHILKVLVNGKPSKQFDAKSVMLYADTVPADAQVVIYRSTGRLDTEVKGDFSKPAQVALAPEKDDSFWNLASALPDDIGNDQPLRIGAASTGGNRFVGEIRRASIYARELSSEEIATLAKDSSAKIDGALVDYDFKNLVDGQVKNSVSNDFTLKMIGSINQGENAAVFTGDGYLQTDFDLRLHMKDAFTLSAWICPAGFSDVGMRIIDKVTAGVDDGYLFDLWPGSLRCITERGVLQVPVPAVAGQWAHVAASLKPDGQLKLYFNGQEVGAMSARPLSVSADTSKWPRIGAFYSALVKAGLAECYEAQHARLMVQTVEAIHERGRLLKSGELELLPVNSQAVANRLYFDTVGKLAEGLQKTVESYNGSNDAHKQQVLKIWHETE